jgi:hypothetical protein
MANEYPPLDFDDLVHIMSPSPAPPSATLDDSQLPLRPRSTSPEPPNDVGVPEMRMDILATQDSNARENEPAEMVRYVLFDINKGPWTYLSIGSEANQCRTS